MLRSGYAILDQWILSSKITQSDFCFRRITLAALWKTDWKAIRIEVVGPVNRLL